MFFASLIDNTIKTIYMVHELIMCHDGAFNLRNDFFDKTDINLFIDFVCAQVKVPYVCVLVSIFLCCMYFRV